jgi:4-hydroxy-tetrahydrodipicolinate synthase
MPLRKGSTCALITPFDETGKIDVAGLEKLLQWHLEGGTDNLCVLGTTAESAVMDMDDRALILKTVVERCKGKIPLLIGTGTINPEHVKEMTQQAIDMGADASLLVTPYYVKPPQRGLIQHFTRFADMGLPVIMYNVPGRTACNMEDATVLELAQHPNVAGIKDATGDLSRLEPLKSAMKGLPGTEEFLFLSGDDGTTKDFILMGGDGCISVTANIVPHMMKEMTQAALRGDVKRANELDDRLALLHKKLFVESNPIGCKWAAKRIGLIESDYCRPPLAKMDPKFETVVDEALSQAGFLGVSRIDHMLATHDDYVLPAEERVHAPFS